MASTAQTEKAAESTPVAPAARAAQHAPRPLFAEFPTVQGRLVLGIELTFGDKVTYQFMDGMDVGARRETGAGRGIYPGFVELIDRGLKRPSVLYDDPEVLLSHLRNPQDRAAAVEAARKFLPTMRRGSLSATRAAAFEQWVKAQPQAKTLG